MKLGNMFFYKKTEKYNVQGFLLNNILVAFEAFSDAKFFGRKDIMAVCHIQVLRAGDLLSKLRECGVVESVKGHCKGKYRFIV